MHLSPKVSLQAESYSDGMLILHGVLVCNAHHMDSIGASASITIERSPRRHFAEAKKVALEYLNACPVLMGGPTQWGTGKQVLHRLTADW